MDPFLSGINEQHARQESADSGLGLGSAYSLPHTPEDFLANIDDNMDGTSGKVFVPVCDVSYRKRQRLVYHKLCIRFVTVKLKAFLLFSFADGGAPMETPDLSTLSDNIDSTDDLVPSLQVLAKSPCVEVVANISLSVCLFVISFLAERRF